VILRLIADFWKLNKWKEQKSYLILVAKSFVYYNLATMLKYVIYKIDNSTV